jgi:N4-(beta-N-acetylglucosaminyl)-L-asparaginase
MNRREIIKMAAVSPIALPLMQYTESGKKFPVVISTWRFGIQANEEAWKILGSGGKALDSVEKGVRLIESDPKERSVGYGGLPDRDGHVTLDACIMDHLSNCGAVAGLEYIKNPISVARLIMEKTPHVLIVGEGALQFALNNGFTKENLLTPESEKDWKEWLKKSEYKPVINIENHDTIGMLAIDASGNPAGACTTSGMAYKMHGRVGDSPIIGAGLFVDNEVGAATATGHGEEIIRVAGCHTVVELMRQGYSPQKACEEAVKRIYRKRKNVVPDIQAGFIALDKDGNHGAYCIHPGFNYAICREASGNQLVNADSLLK